MIAAARKRNGSVLTRLSKAPVKWTRRLDRTANRGLERAHPPLSRAGRRSKAAAQRGAAVAGPRLRPVGFLVLPRPRARRPGIAPDRRRRGAGGDPGQRRRHPPASPRLRDVAAGAYLVASQFVDYRGGGDRPARLRQPARESPSRRRWKSAPRARRNHMRAGLGLAAVALGLPAGRRIGGGGLPRRRPGLVSIAVVLLVDLPHGLDAGTQTSRFSGATAVLKDGFYAELAAAAGPVLAGLLYYARPCRIRINLSEGPQRPKKKTTTQASSPATPARRA